MPTDEIEFECEEQMEKAVEYLRQELRGVRTGRASPALVEHMKIDVASYGSAMELRELANISVPEGNMIMVKPYDPSVIKDVEKAIQSSGIGITPQSDGKVIRLPVPPLSGERRQQLLAQVRKFGETQKVAVRNLRRDANRKIDAEQKEKKLISEDEATAAKENVQELIKKFEGRIDEMVTAKSKEIEED